VVRASRHFELFYFTHLLYVAWFVVLILHAPTFLFWGGLPLFGFCLEQVLRLRRRGVPAAVKQIEALRSGVTRLTLERPREFAFAPADYVFLRVPAVARREWHPFTISSAPEAEDLVVHVRSLGNWSGALRRVAEEREARRPAQGLVAYVDGPYGTPSAGIFASRFPVLIGAGIGVTPFASVLDSLVRRANGQGPPVQISKAYFFWLNRDQFSFEWFRALLANLEATDTRGLLDVHLCMTGAQAGATALGLELSREVMYSSGRSDLITGLRTHTHAGAPDWPALLGEIERRHAPDKVDVYFCGPRGLARKLRVVCARLGMPFHEERF
jgi:predicted ferric reductase